MPALARRAYANASRLVATAPTNALLSLTLGRAAIKLGEAHQREHADADARAAYEQAHAAVKPWFQHDTMSRDFRVIGAQALANVGRLLRASAHPQAAIDPFQQALALAPTDLKPFVQIDLARTYATLGDRDAAEREVERLVAAKPDGATLLHAAEVLAQCAAVAKDNESDVRDRRAARAVALIERAIQAGQAPPDPKRFELLQGRPDFQRLVKSP